MNKAHINLLRESYSDICEQYLKAFCDNYNLRYEKDAWVANETGTIACVGNEFFDFHDVVKYSVDNQLCDYDDLMQWYDYTLFAHEYNQTIPNFQSWSRGCPRLSKEEQERLINLKKDFDDAVKEYKERNKNPF